MSNLYNGESFPLSPPDWYEEDEFDPRERDLDIIADTKLMVERKD